MDTSTFYIFLFVHLSGLVLGFGAVMVTDLYGMLWLWDRVRFPQLIRVSGVTEKIIWAGWVVLVTAGVPLAMLKGFIDELMVIKLVLVAMVGLNGVPLYLLQKKLRAYKEVDEVPSRVIFRMGLCLLVSQIGWWGAMLIGFLHRHVQTQINWPSQPWLSVGLLIGSILLIWGAGEALLKKTETETGGLRKADRDEAREKAKAEG